MFASVSGKKGYVVLFGSQFVIILTIESLIHVKNADTIVTRLCYLIPKR